MDHIVRAMRAIAEPTRMRILCVLGRGELTVSELTRILGQSQPRVSRHVGLLVDAGCIERLPEGTWVFLRLVSDNAISDLVGAAIAAVPSDDRTIGRDAERLELVSAERATNAARYFRESAADWDQIRSLYLAEDAVEQALLAAIGEGPFERMLDIGTGSGRILEILSGRIAQGLGIDLSHEMLNLARSKLQGKSNCKVQQADLFSLPVAATSQDLVTLHLVLHHLANPEAALIEASRVLRPGGTLALVDFAPHQYEFLRDKHAHRRLGFTNQEIDGWLQSAGLIVSNCQALAPADRPEGQPSLTVKVWTAKHKGEAA